MKTDIISIRPFIGTKNHNISRAFYCEFGFEEVVLSKTMSYFKMGNFGFYLQDAYVKDWVDNSMLFLEVKDLTEYRREILSKNLTKQFPKVRISEIQVNDWGNEFFVHDPSGILWHIGCFKSIKT